MEPKRTGATGLSNSEILILDFLAMLGKANIQNLYNENYPIHMNTSYSHGLSDQELLLVLHELVKKGLVSRELPFLPKSNECIYPTSRNYYSITVKGGVEWANERTPVWSKYCTDSTNEEGKTVEFRCVDMAIGKQFAEIALHSKLYQFSFEELVLNLLPPGSLFSWIKFKHEFCWIAPLKQCADDKEQNINWDFYQKNRCWWSTLEELQTLI